ncbi:MAG TPA: hypothetical protein VH371_02525 [Candidatus Limnocylindrales bacterium]
MNRRVPVFAVVALAASGALAACGSSPLSTPAPTSTTAPVQVTAVPSTTSVGTPTPTSTAAVASTPSPSTASSQGPATTPIPGSTLDPSLSDAGVVGRLVIPADTRNDYTGTHDIVGLASDASDCSYSLEGDEFTAVAWYDDAPNGMLHQMAVTVPADTVPSNDGELRAAISSGSVYADFVNETGFGSAYSGATSKGDGSSSSIDIVLHGNTLVFTFTGTTWDKIDFSGQMMCAGMAHGGE